MRISEFSEYNGGDQFLYQQKILSRGKCLGEGCFANVFLFESKDKKTRYAVKCEKAFLSRYAHGFLFENEAKWYRTIYGLGILSGYPAYRYAPHYILMPYFSGQLLQFKSFSSKKELFFYWIWTAIAIRDLHQRHRVVHGDVKIDNIIVENNHVYLIDFGFSASVGEIRKFYFSLADREYIRHQPPELFLYQNQEKKANEFQDVYSLGYLLKNLFRRFFADEIFYPTLCETQKKVNDVIHNMMLYQPEQRWSIEKSIYMLSVACLASLPKTIWLHIEAQPLLTIPIFFDTAIQVRIDELTEEQDKSKPPSLAKEKKITGLRNLQGQIAEKPRQALEAVFEARQDNALIAGFFSHRTRTLLSELSELGEILRLLH